MLYGRLVSAGQNGSERSAQPLVSRWFARLTTSLLSCRRLGAKAMRKP